MPHKDYIPDSYRNLRDWTRKMLENIDPIAGRVKWPADTLADFKLRIGRIRDKAQTVLDTQDTLDQAIGQLGSAKDADLSDIRQDIANLKTTRGFTDGDARTLEVLTGSATLDPTTYQPDLSAEAKRGRIELSARKYGADSLNVYCRRKGEAGWRLLAAKRVRFPLDDEIGQPSGIVTAVFVS